MFAQSQLSPNRNAVVCLLALGMAVRAATTLHPYSGESDPPKYGDYEAQRHWMEITLHLPPSEWYRDTPHNDLSYWGLDYPPLSAYSSQAFAKFLQYIDPDSVALHTSRGYESPKSRAAMRATVLFVDIVLFFPALLLLSTHLYTPCNSNDVTTAKSSILQVIAFITTLPSLIMIDHAHFQYNNFSLALFLFSLSCFITNNHSLGAGFFCAAVYFKHLTMYYALAIFAFLLKSLFQTFKRIGVLSALKFAICILCAIVAITILVFFPWLREPQLLPGLLRRLFPLTRGLYEDKVANVWCSISVLVKLNKLLIPSHLFYFCAMVTLVASLPFCVSVFLKPSPVRLLLSAAGCSLAAFLFSYQVHEKQVLMPLLPLAILHPLYPSLSIWMSLTATFSLFPLLWREQSSTAYIATIVIHASLVLSMRNNVTTKKGNVYKHILAVLSVFIGCVLNLTIVFGNPPKYAPDMFVLMNTMYACSHFCVIFIILGYESFAS